MTAKGVAADPEFSELVRRDVFEETTEEEIAHLHSDAVCERWVVELRRVVNSLKDQLDNHGTGRGPKRTEEWRASAGYLFVKYCEALEEAKVIANELRARWRAGDVPALEGELHRLRGAIRAHQYATEEADAEPEEWDLLLWAHLDKPANKPKRVLATAPVEA